MSAYHNRMRLSMPDKVFFLDKIPGTQILVDWGCADGTLIKLAREFIHPSVLCIGFDNDITAIRKAQVQKVKNCRFVAAFATTFLSDLDKDKRVKTILFSSILHDCHTEVHDALLGLRKNPPKYIVIRDMCYEGPYDIAPGTFKFPADKAANLDFTTKGNKRGRTLHQLLHSMYMDNWENEWREDYFSAPWQRIIDFCFQHGYRVFYDHKYLLPYIQVYAEKFHIDLAANHITTHRQLILRRSKHDTCCANEG